MKKVNKLNPWFWAFMLLVVLNIAAVATMFRTVNKLRTDIELGPPEQRPPLNFRRLFNGDRSFSPEQRKELNQIRQDHHLKMREIKGQIHQRHMEIIDLISQEDFAEDDLKKLREQIGKAHDAMVMETISFYENLESVCTPEQMQVIQRHMRNNDFNPERQGRGQNRGKNRNGRGNRNRMNPNNY